MEDRGSPSLSNNLNAAVTIGVKQPGSVSYLGCHSRPLYDVLIGHMDRGCLEKTALMGVYSPLNHSVYNRKLHIPNSIVYFYNYFAYFMSGDLP